MTPFSSMPFQHQEPHIRMVPVTEMSIFINDNGEKIHIGVYLCQYICFPIRMFNVKLKSFHDVFAARCPWDLFTFIYLENIREKQLYYIKAWEGGVQFSLFTFCMERLIEWCLMPQDFYSRTSMGEKKRWEFDETCITHLQCKLRE